MEYILNEEKLYIALSDLFVDKRIDYSYIASIAKLFPTSHVEYVLFNYVAPACYYNTVVPVPPVCWFFDTDILFNKICNIKKNENDPINKAKMYLLSIFFKYKFKHEWKKLKNLL